MKTDILQTKPNLRVTLDAVFLTQLLVFSTVNLGQLDSFLVLELGSSFLVVRSKTLAVATPWSEEFYQSELFAIDFRVKVGAREIDNVGGGSRGGGKKKQGCCLSEELHDGNEGTVAQVLATTGSMAGQNAIYRCCTRAESTETVVTKQSCGSKSAPRLPRPHAGFAFLFFLVLLFGFGHTVALVKYAT